MEVINQTLGDMNDSQISHCQRLPDAKVLIDKYFLTVE
jgi:hypothetical protein